MRSTETSGVGAKGFVSLASSRQTDTQSQVAAAADYLSRIKANVSPVTVAIALTALLAVSLFFLYELTRTLHEARAFSAAPGDIPFDELLPGVIGRSVIALAVAGLLVVLTFRRSDADKLSPTTRRRAGDVLAALPFGIACWTGDGRLVLHNDDYCRQLGLASAGIKEGTAYRAVVGRFIGDGSMHMVKEDETSRLLELHREDGSCLLIEERPLDCGGFVTLVTDVTERKRIDLLLNSIQQEQRQLARRYHEEKLRAEAASRSKTHFLAHLSHDIRTPLNHIIGFAELMAQQAYGPLGNARYRDYVESIRHSGERLLSSFATILELAEFESGQRVLRQDRVDVDALMKAAADRFRPQAKRAGLTFVTGMPTGAVLSADPFALQRMVGNIIDNAIRFTPAGGKVTVAAFAAPDGVVLEITDTGLGMSEERLASLSQPFVLGDSTFTRETGAGLGIAIARAIAEQSGGRLAIDSSPQLGTTVAISLPVAQVMPHVAAEAA